MPASANLVHELSASTGTGNFTLTAQNGKQRFSTAFGTGVTLNVFDYFISNQDAAEWERGTGHMSAVGTLVRDTVLESTNANAAVNFSAGTKDVTNDVPSANRVRVENSGIIPLPSGASISWNSGAATITEASGAISINGTPFSASVQATGLNGIDGDQLFIFKTYTDAPGIGAHPSAELANLRVQRSANYTGGTPGNVENTIWARHTVAAGVANFEWSILAQLDNSATAGENVALYGQATKQSGAGPTWGGTYEVRDKNTNPTNGAIGVEVGLFANGGDSNGVRVNLDVVGGKDSGAGSTPDITYGIRIGPQGGTATEANFLNGVYLNKNFAIGINLSNADCTTADIVTKGAVGFGTSTPDRRLHSEVGDAVTAATTYAARLTHTTSGTAAAGFGVGIESELENAAGTNKVSGALEWVWTDATNATEDCDLLVKLMTAGAAAAETARFTSTGRLDLSFATDAVFRAFANSAVDMRMTASNASTVGFIGTSSNHDVVLTANNNNAWRVGTDGSLKGINPTGGLGYATGAGGTVTQATSKTTGVILNKICGQITMATGALAAGAAATFTLTNSTIAATDIVDVCVTGGGTANAYTADVVAVAAGSCAIQLRNSTAGSLTEAGVIVSFAVRKSANS